MPAKRLLLEITKCNARCIAETGDIDASKVAELIERAIDTTQDRHALLVGLGDFIASSLSGSVPHPRH